MSLPASDDHDLAAAFDHQAAKFETAPVQSDRRELMRLVQIADLPPDSLVLDAGCGPGLVARALLESGYRVIGVDLSAEMITRAQNRCAEFGDKARFIRGSIYSDFAHEPFDAAISRYVLHHVADPAAFISRQVALLRPGGIVVLSDHTTDPDPARAAWHQEIEIARDHTHRTNLTPGQMVDLLSAAGLGELRLAESSFALDFDEWFDRGSPRQPKETVRRRMLDGTSARGFHPCAQAGGAIRIACWRASVRGIKPERP